jgi:hypothetical protein
VEIDTQSISQVTLPNEARSKCRTPLLSIDFRRQIDDTPRLVGALPGEAEVIMTDDSQEREAR